MACESGEQAAGQCGATADGAPKGGTQASGCGLNVYRTLARHPLAFEALSQLEAATESLGRFPPDEHAVVALEVARACDCDYCQAVFVGEAREHAVNDECIDAILGGRLPAHGRLRRLVQATRRIMEARGHLGGAEQELLAEAGVDQRDLLEIVTIIATYTLATYVNNLAGTRIDPEFR
jgi:alkylhydroperoxidase family enzyme